MPTPLNDPSRQALTARELQTPLAVSEQPLRRIRVRLDVEPPLDSKGCLDASELDPSHGRPFETPRRRTGGGALGRRLLPVRSHEGAHPVGRLCTLPDPVVDARQ